MPRHLGGRLRADVGRSGCGGRGAEVGPGRDDDFFESKVRPVLAEHCYKCHSAQAKSLKGGLRLDSLDGMRKGGDTGPAVVPGDLEASLLVKAVKYDDEVLRMPPKGKLPDASIAALAQWVKDGAVGPHAAETALGRSLQASTSSRPAGTGRIGRSASLESPQSAIEAWPRSPIDSFVLAWLEAARA